MECCWNQSLVPRGIHTHIYICMYIYLFYLSLSYQYLLYIYISLSYMIWTYLHIFLCLYSHIIVHEFEKVSHKHCASSKSTESMASFVNAGIVENGMRWPFIEMHEVVPETHNFASAPVAKQWLCHLGQGGHQIQLNQSNGSNIH